MKWRVAAGITVGLFAAGVAVGYAAEKRGIPRDQVGRWALKEATRKVLHAYDRVRDLLPDPEVATPLADALRQEPPRPEPG
jgi:hypothetical protein